MSIVAKKIIMGSGAVALPSDDEFNRVSFLSHFDGANNGVNNAFIDGHDTSSPHTITANGNVTQGSFGPFARPDGEWSVEFDGTGDYLDANDGVTFGTGAFTIELFVYIKSNAQAFFFDARPTGVNTTYPVIYMQSNRTLVYYANSGTKITSSTSEKLSEYTWHHVAVCRSGTSTKMFLNGTQVGSTYSDSTNYSDSGRMRIGANKNAGNDVEGYMSNVRVVNSALYTSNFTPPTAPLTAITGTKLLTCQSNRFVDNSADGLTITPAGDPAVTAFGPFLTDAVYDATVNGASASFDGSVSTNLTAADSADWDFGSDNYTIEFWMYATSSGIQGIFCHWGDFNGVNIAWSFEINSSTNLRFLFKTNITRALTVTTGANDYLNQWVHVAAVRNNNVHTVYLNGVSKAATTKSEAMNNCTAVLRVGAYQATYGFNGEICDARIVKGTAVYTGNFTPPTAPLTKIDNTKLLLNMADGQAIDSAAQNNLTLYGTAKTSTAQKKFGTASLLLDGNSDYATFTENGGNDIDGGGNWTVEFFWRFVNKTSPSIQEIISKGAGFQLYTINGSLSFALSANNSGTYFINGTGGTTLDNDTFYHISLVKNGTSYKLYLNGTSDLSATSSSNIDTGGYPWFLGTISGAESTYPSNGYMDEVRISQFARYTSNFTAPSEPFPDKGQ